MIRRKQLDCVDRSATTPAEHGRHNNAHHSLVLLRGMELIRHRPGTSLLSILIVVSLLLFVATNSNPLASSPLRQNEGPNNFVGHRQLGHPKEHRPSTPPATRRPGPRPHSKHQQNYRTGPRPPREENQSNGNSRTTTTAKTTTEFEVLRHESDLIDYADYRLGDLFYLFFLADTSTGFHNLQEWWANEYPDTVADFYLKGLGDSPKYGYRNVTILSTAIEKFKDQRRSGGLDLPSPTELVVHLRLADTMTDPKYTDVSRSVEDLWNTDGFINLWDGIKYNYNEEEWRQILTNNIFDNPDAGAEKIEKITIVGSDVRRTIDAHKTRNQEYTDLVTNLLQEEFPHSPISHYKTRNPDRALAFMSSANWLIVGNGGFGQMAKAIVNLNRPSHAFSDLYECMLVGADDGRLTEEEQEFFSQNYADTENYFQKHFGHPWPQFLQKFL